MNAKKLVKLMEDDAGNMKSFAEKHGLKYTTIYQATRDDSRVDNMRVSLFIEISRSLGMTPETLAETLEYEFVRLDKE